MMLVPISKPLQRALEALSNETGEPIPQLVADALSHGLGIPVHTLFQVSTSGALVQGIYERAVSSTFLLNYGDFGIGTFDNLDGEMVVLDGVIYQVRSDGIVNKIVDDTGTPFAVVAKLIAAFYPKGSTANEHQEIVQCYLCWSPMPRQGRRDLNEHRNNSAEICEHRCSGDQDLRLRSPEQSEVQQGDSIYR
jgi:hypothetical protein